MAQLVPVDIDPFAVKQEVVPPGYTAAEVEASKTKPRLTPVEHDPFAAPAGHDVAGPSDNMLFDTGRRIGSAVLNAGVGMVSPLIGHGYAPAVGPSGEKLPPMPKTVEAAKDNAYNTAGLTEYAPETWAGRRIQDALTGTAGAMMGGAGIRALPGVVGGSATSGAGAEAIRNMGGSPRQQLLAATLGFIPGAWLGNQAVTIPQRLASPILGGEKTEPYGAFTRQGMPTSLSGTSTGSPSLTYAEKLAARMPGSEGAVAGAADKLTSAWRDRLDEVASRMGAAATPQEAGVSLVKAAQGWLSDFKATTGKLWGDFYSKVPQDTPIGVSNYKDALDGVLGNFSGAQASGKVLQPGTVKSLSDALGVDLKAGNTLPWEAVKNIRTAIGEKLANPQTISDTSQSALKQIYKGLTADMEAGAGGVSPDALSSFYKANVATAAGHDLLEKHLDPILKATNPEEATRHAMSEARLGGSRLGAVTFNLPSAAGDLGSYALRNAATNTESPTSLAMALMGRKPIYSEEAQRVLFPDTGTRADIGDLATIGRSMQPLQKDIANSPTATHAARGVGRILAAGELARLGHDVAGIPGAIGGGALGLLSPEVIGGAARATALNPYLSALQGYRIPYEPPGALATALMAPGVLPQLMSPRVAPLPGAIPANSVRQ